MFRPFCIFCWPCISIYLS